MPKSLPVDFSRGSHSSQRAPGERFLKTTSHVMDEQGSERSRCGTRPGKGLRGEASVIFEEEQIFLLGLDLKKDKGLGHLGPDG